MVYVQTRIRNRKGFALLELLASLVVLVIVAYFVWTSYSRVLMPEEEGDELSVPPIQAAAESVDLTTARMLHSTVTLLINEGVPNPTDEAVIASRIAGGYPTPQTGGVFEVRLDGGNVVITWGENEEYSFPE